MSESEALIGQDAKLIIMTDVEEKVLSVKAISTPESIGTDAIKKFSTRYFALGGRVGALFGAVKPEEIKIAKTTGVFRPYWRITAGYACRYLRKHNHQLPLESDVESVTIYGKPQSVTGEKVKLSDLLASVGASTSLGYGPVKISLGPLQNLLKGKISSLLGSKDAELEKKVELNIGDVTERATYTYTGRFLFDANLGTESKEIYDSLEGRDLHPVSEAALKRQGHLVEATYTKEEVTEEVRKRLTKEPEETPRRILEQEFRLTEMNLIYLPFYDLTLEYKDKMRPIRINGMTGEIKEV